MGSRYVSKADFFYQNGLTIYGYNSWPPFLYMPILATRLVVGDTPPQLGHHGILCQPECVVSGCEEVHTTHEDQFA